MIQPLTLIIGAKEDALQSIIAAQDIISAICVVLLAQWIMLT